MKFQQTATASGAGSESRLGHLVTRARGVERVFRWDLDKTYLVSHFESLRGLLAVPFEKAEDKVALPGVTAVIRGLHDSEEKRGRHARVFFLSASPPQIGGAIREKLALDGVRYDGISFKNQMSHLVRGRFDALREQIGYKLEQLFISARALNVDAVEYLFGDDWESDPFVYSLYADVLSRRVDRETLSKVLVRAGVHRHYIERIVPHFDWIAEDRPRHRVEGIFVLRQRRVLPVELEMFGPRLTWFDNYLECALALYARGIIDLKNVVDVAQAVGLDPPATARSFLAACGRRTPVTRGQLEPVRRALMGASLMSPVKAGRLWPRLAAWMRERLGLARMPSAKATAVPDYVALVDQWSHRRRKERQ